MTADSLISIIIPVYNVEKYLDECISSVVAQTYKNLEIILVDDGSTDSSGRMCNEWKEKDSRIIVIHKPNGGLSDARNAGLKIAKGEYIGYVDSDDYISENMYEVLMGLCLENDVQLSCVRFDTLGGGFSTPADNGKKEVMTPQKMLTITTWPWYFPDWYTSIGVMHRLYKKELIEGMEFPVGKQYEDVVYGTEVIHKAGRIAMYNKSLYHYRTKREGSITAKDTEYNERWLTDKLPQEKIQMKLLSEYGYKDVLAMCRFRAAADLYKLRYRCSNEEKIKEINKEIKDMNVSAIEMLRYIPGFKWKIKTAVKTMFLGPYAKSKVEKARKMYQQ